MTSSTKPRCRSGLKAAIDRIAPGRPSRAARCSAERTKRLEASASAGDDRVRIGAPDEGLCLGLVVLGYETIDRGLEVGDGAKDAVLQASAGELGEEALDGVQP